MAPIDRREHRQQRVRGAGPSSVQASFGFNFGALGARPAPKASLPPQRSSRRTPVRSTPRSANGSAKRHRSASVQRSGSVRRKLTPKGRTVTPQLGKRKRGSSHAQPGSDDGEEDELSPNREEIVRSIEKSRRVVGAISPIHEELDEAPDELSILEESARAATKSFLDASAASNGTPVSVLAKKRPSPASVPQRTPIADRVGRMSVASRQSISRRSKSTDLGLSTPTILLNGQSRLSALPSGPDIRTPGSAPVDEGSEDELSPPQINGTTPRIIAKELQPQARIQEEGGMDVDELSSPAQPTPSQVASATQNKSGSSAQPAPKRGRPKRVVEDDQEDEHVTTTPIQPARGRPRKTIEAKEPAVEPTPAARKPIGKRKQDTAAEDENEDLDELSPETKQTAQRPGNDARRKRSAVESDAEASDTYKEPAQEDEPEPTPQPIAKRPASKSIQHLKPSIEKPPHKRQKFSGPKHAISVMRIKGSTVRGITVADTARTILEESIDYRLKRMVEKMQNSSNSAQRKELRSDINLSLSFKESLDEKLLDLQDANDVLSINFKKMKLFRRDNVDLRKEILALQNMRQEIALEHDDVQAVFEAEKEKIETRNTLNANMFDIEAAIQNGREKARKEGREDEGPQIPLHMLLETMGREVGSLGGGLLSNVKAFNGALERAAGWLEGRA